MLTVVRFALTVESDVIKSHFLMQLIEDGTHDKTRDPNTYGTTYLHI